ncbi:RnfH family protein [Gammaproteobacteria bacterium]|nr:RnfH family protein [Gammaproteobacteria bacterium]
MVKADHLSSAVSKEETINVEVAFVLPQRQMIISLRVAKDCTALEAVKQSAIDKKFPGVDFTDAAMGIFSRPLNGIDLPKPEQYVVKENDRVEIYRNLLKDPKQARLDRVQKKTQRQMMP